MINSIKVTILLLTFAAVFTTCSTAPSDISSDLSAPELIQRAQEASDRNRYKTSLLYYEAVLERYAFDLNYVCEAEYEIAFIKYKQKDYIIARAGLMSLLKHYEGPDMELLPQHFKILSNIVLEKIDVAESKRKK